jgi:hypothetical protein
MKKITLLLASVGLATFAGSVYAQTESASTPALASTVAIQEQLVKLEKEVDALKQDASKHVSTGVVAAKKGDPRTSFVSISPFIGEDAEFDGSELIVNQASVNDDRNLLAVRHRVDSAMTESDADAPHLTFSGMLEGQVSEVSNYDHTDTGDINLTIAKLDSYLEINHWISAFMTMSYNDAAPNTTNVNRINNSGFQLNQGEIILGNFASSPFYASIGQMYAPFGQYTSLMVTDSFAKTLGRVQTRALNVGYMAQNETGVQPYAAAYTFKGNADIDNDDTNNKIDEFGLNAGLKYTKDQLHTDFSLSGISDLAESQGMQGTASASDADFGGFAQTSSYEDLDHRVPGIDAEAVVNYGPTTFITEYVTGTTDFDENDMSFDGHGAKPRALNTELAYAFHWMKPSSVALTYNHSWEALAVGLPESRIGATYTVNMWRHTALSFEVLRDTGYSTGTTATAAGNAKPVNTDQLGETYTSYIMSVDAYF